MTASTTEATGRTRLNTGWRFGGAVDHPGRVDHLDPRVLSAQAHSDLDDSAWPVVTLPHTVTPLSWDHWDPQTWEKVWVYRRGLELTPDGRRLFLDFDAALTNTSVWLDGELLGEHHGGYLPFSFEITDRVEAGGPHVLTVVVDSRFNLNVPPNIPDPARSNQLDFWQPGGIHRDVWLRSVPVGFVSGISTTHHDVLVATSRRSTFVVTIDSTVPIDGAELSGELRDRDGTLVATAQPVTIAIDAGVTEATLEVTDLADVELWDVDAPHLYDFRATLSVGGSAMHGEQVRTGYREARFELDGFYLNGRRRYLMGVNRHGYFPFTGFSMPDRVHRRDVEIIKGDLNCVMVRCAHYPQTASFLDACDELGLLVWEESPGWQYVGDSAWQDQAVTDITEMIARDRHRPSIIVWGARLNETPDRPEFNARTEALVKRLDPTRTTSGTMHSEYVADAIFQHDLFSYDDYNVRRDSDGDLRPDLLEPLPGRPYLISEALATLSSPTTLYSRDQVARVQQHQSLDYALANDDAMGDHRYSGLLAWVGFDYQAGMGNHVRGVRVSGLADVFRIPKPGSAIYRAQIDPAERPVLEPAFTWDPPEYGYSHAFSGHAIDRSWGPGARAMFCTNLDRIEVFLGDESLGVILPDRERFPNLPYAPSFVDLSLAEGRSTDLRVDGYLGDDLVVQRRFSGDRTGDGLTLVADDVELIADGSDATRVVLMVVDKFGEPRGKSHARVHLVLKGPGELIGDNPFNLDETGGVAAVWVRTRAGEPGDITLRAFTPELGMVGITITSTADQT